MKWFKSLLTKTGVAVPVNSSVQEIQFNVLEQWLEQQKTDILSHSHFIDEIQQNMQELKEKRRFLELKLDAWQHRSVQHGTDAEKAEAQTFFVRTRQLLEKVNFPADFTIDYAFRVYDALESNTENILTSLTQHHFSQHFVFMLTEEESKLPLTLNPLIKELVDLDEFREIFQRLVVESGYPALVVLRQRFQELQRLNTCIAQWEQSIIQKQARLTQAADKKKEKEAEVQSLQQHPHYASVAEIDKKRRLRRIQKNDVEDIISTFFSTLKPALEALKQQQEGQRDILDSYCRDPVPTFLQDEHLKIVGICQYLLSALPAGKLSLDLKKLDVIVPLLEKACTGYLGELQREYRQVQEELHLLSTPTQQEVFLNKIEEVHYRLDHFTRQVDHLGGEISSLQGEITAARELRTRQQQEFEHIALNSLGKRVQITDF
ncbi:TPA: hypothetical protein HA241_02970 [Candidatus Woesearchaeota archaeon]|nr:hypothetical protein [Candidatus Woesearchaeota archaeon]